MFILICFYCKINRYHNNIYSFHFLLCTIANIFLCKEMWFRMCVIYLIRMRNRFYQLFWIILNLSNKEIHNALYWFWNHKQMLSLIIFNKGSASSFLSCYYAQCTSLAVDSMSLVSMLRNRECCHFDKFLCSIFRIYFYCFI